MKYTLLIALFLVSAVPVLATTANYGTQGIAVESAPSHESLAPVNMNPSEPNDPTEPTVEAPVSAPRDVSSGVGHQVTPCLHDQCGFPENRPGAVKVPCPEIIHEPNAVCYVTR